MERRLKDTLRAGATAVGVATGLLALASTAQTPDGYIHASFGGPLDVFSSSTPAEVLAIGDGTNDATELAALLKGPVGPTAKDRGVPNSPYRVAYEAGAAPIPDTGSMTVPSTETPTTAAPTRKDAATLPPKPVVDSQGKINCSGAVSCHTDPTTNITTVTYPDGVVAVVQKINDLTVVAYKSLTEVLPIPISSLLPPVPATPPPLLAAVAPAPVPTVTPTAPIVAATAPIVAPEPVVKAQAPETASASIDPGPPAPSPNLDLTDSGPKVNITTPPKDFSPGTETGSTGSGIDAAPKDPSLGGKVKDTIGGVVDAVKGAVGSALSPGASSKPENSDGSNSSSQGSASDNAKSDSSSGGSSNGS